MSLPTRAQARRLRELYRSAGWPCQDALELELLAAGWLERLREADGRERLRLTEAGVQAAVAGLQRNRAALGAHQQLVARVADELQRAGRVVWTGLALRAGLPESPPRPTQSAPPPEAAATPWGGPAASPRADAAGRLRWRLCQPDVYSLRPSSKPEGLEVCIHEVKVSRADLLTELRKPDKSAAYAALAGQTVFVLAAGIAEPEEIPAAYGVWIAHADRFELARAAPRRPHQPDFASWLALARAPARAPLDEIQPGLG